MRPKLNPKAHVYFIVRVSESKQVSPPRYRVLRGSLGGKSFSKGGIRHAYVERKNAIMVFDYDGKLNKSLTIEIEE